MRQNAPSEIIDLNAILDDAAPPERIVPLCLNGKIRRQYDEVAARIAERAAEREAAAKAAKAAGMVVDDRLGAREGSGPNGEPPAPLAVRDPEQDLADELLEKVRKRTVPFLITAIPAQDWVSLMERHPPRKDPATGRLDPRDVDGINSSTFYPELVKKAIAEPDMDDVQYERVMGVLSDAQFNRLSQAAGEINVQDEDIPFSLSGSGTLPA